MKMANAPRLCQFQWQKLQPTTGPQMLPLEQHGILLAAAASGENCTRGTHVEPKDHSNIQELTFRIAVRG
jgi:hypothetical protein